MVNVNGGGESGQAGRVIDDDRGLLVVEEQPAAYAHAPSF